MKMNRQVAIKSSYDFKTKYFIPLVVVALMITIYLIDKNQDYSTLIGMVILFILAGLFSIFLIPYKILLVNDEFVELKRVHKNIRIQLSEIVDIDLIDFGNLIRLNGIDGFLGYYGDYESFSHGTIKLMAKSSRNLIIVCTNEYKIVFSVDDIDWCEQLKATINKNT